MTTAYFEQEGVARSMSDAPPTHYIVKIQSFSLHAKNAIKKYESGVFEAGSYKWKLVLYPNGNQSCNVKEHISLYLAIADTSKLTLASVVHVIFRLFLLDQKEDKYLIVQGARRFHQFKTECGFDEFIPLQDFNNASNGYLVDDSCVLGAEVFVKKSTSKGECLSLIKDATSVKHIWKIENFSKLESKVHYSEEFKAEEQKWKIELHPNGHGTGNGSHLSMFLALSDPKNNITPGSKIYTSFKLCIKDQLQAKHEASNVVYHWFTASSSAWGFPQFVSLSDFNLSGNGFIVNDVCILEVEVTVLGITKEL